MADWFACFTMNWWIEGANTKSWHLKIIVNLKGQEYSPDVELLLLGRPDPVNKCMKPPNPQFFS